MFTDSTSRRMRPSGLKLKSDLLFMVEGYIADTGKPRAFRAGGKFISVTYIRICDGRGIRRENMLPESHERPRRKQHMNSGQGWLRRMHGGFLDISRRPFLDDQNRTASNCGRLSLLVIIREK